MNIFILDREPEVAAQYHCDQHMKMLLESGQMLSTAHRLLDGTKYFVKGKGGRKVARWRLDDHREDTLYKAGHVNHPCNVWIRESCENYMWVYRLMASLNGENVLRRGKDHKTWTDLKDTLAVLPDNIPNVPMTPFAIATNGVGLNNDPVDAYREFYQIDKARFATWELGRAKPEWYTPENMNA